MLFSVFCSWWLVWNGLKQFQRCSTQLNNALYILGFGRHVLRVVWVFLKLFEAGLKLFCICVRHGWNYIWNGLRYVWFKNCLKLVWVYCETVWIMVETVWNLLKLFVTCCYLSVCNIYIYIYISTVFVVFYFVGVVWVCSLEMLEHFGDIRVLAVLVQSRWR